MFRRGGTVVSSDTLTHFDSLSRAGRNDPSLIALSLPVAVKSKIPNPRMLIFDNIVS